MSGVATRLCTGYTSCHMCHDAKVFEHSTSDVTNSPALLLNVSPYVILETLIYSIYSNEYSLSLFLLYAQMNDSGI